MSIEITELPVPQVLNQLVTHIYSVFSAFY